MTGWAGRAPGRPPAAYYGRTYRCLYCGIRIHTRTNIPSHEAVCPMRASMQQKWAIEIARGKRKLGHVDA